MSKFIRTLSAILISLMVLGAVYIGIYIYFPASHVSPNNEYDSWDPILVNHILPTFDHEQLLVKVSLKKETDKGVLLKIDSIQLSPLDQDATLDRFYTFYSNGLNADQDYTLQLVDGLGEKLSDPWTIHTLPHPDSLADEMTIMVYTCAGGIDGKFFGQEVFNKVEARQALLQRGLKYDPDVIIANGDHIYWDQKSFKINLLKKLVSKRRDQKFGYLDLDQAMLSDENVNTFTKMADAQIAELYGAYLREYPVLFLADDHDLLENDEALVDLVTLPPADYMLDAGRTTQKLYYPEFLNNKDKPSSFADRTNGNSKVDPALYSSFGLWRYGNLAEINLYDSKRYCDMNGPEAVMIPREVEKWLAQRLRDTSTIWNLQVPSSPFGWTAGKWHEWYPDVLNEEGVLSIENEKYLWQNGWWNQHQRLIQSMNKSPKTPIILQGDLHMAGLGKITRSGKLDLTDNPIYAIGTGPLGSGKLGFPSSIRGSGSEVPLQMEVEEIMSPVEKNGFTILHINPEKINVKIFLWRSPQAISEIEDLKPAFEYDIPRQQKDY